MFRHVRLGKFDANSEKPNGQDNSHHFQGDRVRSCSPGPRIEYVRNEGPYEYSKRRPKYHFVDVEL